MSKYSVCPGSQISSRAEGSVCLWPKVSPGEKAKSANLEHVLGVANRDVAKGGHGGHAPPLSGKIK